MKMQTGKRSYLLKTQNSPHGENKSKFNSSGGTITCSVYGRIQYLQFIRMTLGHKENINFLTISYSLNQRVTKNGSPISRVQGRSLGDPEVGGSTADKLKTIKTVI